MPEAERKPAAEPASASISSAGGRAANEDRSGDGPTGGAGRAFVVADGLGGHAGGALAADRAVTALLRALAEGPALAGGSLARAFAAAGEAVHAAELAEPAARGCRTTAVALVLEGGSALWGHVGDSRLYHLRAGRIAHQTLDHSVPQALVQAGALAPEAIRRHPDRNRVLRSLGGPDPVEVALAPAPIATGAGDAFLLCSDGFWELVPEDVMERTFAAARGPADWLARMERELLAAAHGSFDNYTATAVLIGEPAPAPRSRLAALLARLRGRLVGRSGPSRGPRLQSAALPPGPLAGAAG